MKKNNLVVNILTLSSVLLFLFACVAFKESDAIPLLIIYIVILTCLFCAMIIIIKSFIKSRNENKEKKHG